MKPELISPAVFNNYPIINCRGTLLDLSTPKVMGILNVTPDSFFDGGKFTEEKAIIEHTGKMLAEGADIIDIGAHSTRPGATPVDQQSELNRLLPAIEIILSKYPGTLISIDTFRAEVAEQCVNKGAVIINDVSAGTLDSTMFDVVARLHVPYILMHMQGTPATMQQNPTYKNVVHEVTAFLAGKVAALRKMGVTDILVDPGFGFGKTVAHNFSLLNALPAFSILGCPVLAGFSRKSMICKTLNVNPDKALNGTTALNMMALLNGASVLRVHDVKEAVEVVKLHKQTSHH